jgi:MFS family permease
MRKVAKSDIQKDRVPLDVVGATLCGLGLAAAVFSLIEQARFGWHDWMIRSALSAGIIMLITFLVYESRAEHPMLPLGLFKVRNFTFGNLATTSIYAGLSVATFLLAVFVQQVGGYSAIQAGLALMPVTLLMFFLSPRFGALSGKFGPRWFMTFGPLLGSLGFFLMLNVDKHVSYWPQLLPGIVLFGIGLSATVSPLTSAVLGSIDSKQAGIGSAVNNAIARIAGLVAIAFIGIVTGSHLDVDGFRRGVILTAILLAVGGLISAIGIQNSVKPAETNA